LTVRLRSNIQRFFVVAFFRFILISFVCLISGAAFGRHFQCTYYTRSSILWPESKCCYTNGVDYSAKFETEKHSFYITSSQKSEIQTFLISLSKLEFIPLDILKEFPKLNGLALSGCNLPTLKARLFKKEFQKIQRLNLWLNKIEVIEPNAFQHLIHLKWINLYGNNLQTLPYQLFGKNPELIYVGLSSNKINSIHPNFFDGLQKLKLVDFSRNYRCFNEELGCETCFISQANLRGKLQGCFDNCADCGTFHLTHKTIQSEIITPSTTENHLKETNSEGNVDQENKKLLNSCREEVSGKLGEIFELISRDFKKDIEGVKSNLAKISNDLSKLEDRLTTKMETELKLGTKTTKEAIEANNRNMQECCSANEKRIEKLQKSVDEINTCVAVNQVKMELFEAKCAKKEGALGSEIKALKQEIEGRKATKSQLEVLEVELTSFIEEKLMHWKRNMTTGG
jgi:hypothetical protein